MLHLSKHFVITVFVQLPSAELKKIQKCFFIQKSSASKMRRSEANEAFVSARECGEGQTWTTTTIGTEKQSFNSVKGNGRETRKEEI